MPAHIRIINQAEIVAISLADYLHRHPEIEAKCAKTSQRIFYTTDSTEAFDSQSAVFFGKEVKSLHLDLGK